ncbi:Arginine-binding extracellular protein ArtP [Candidatus Nanosyncoccus alces]|uniref:Arginine-binding extracellular protein ArtP n=2 Tax=Candidatus Nanosyncoccus alces TaxID=2171997 RepID=A0ABY0FLI0_9BACT|nr:Arginine-binding extracellular protein ArtP [Candidatus Nanosyncoccus alces]
MIVLSLIILGVSTYFFAQSIETFDYVVETNAFFAPFEYYDNRKIVGVDIEIIERVAEKLKARIEIKNVEFDLIIDNVANGVIADAGAAGLTITPARAEKVNFSIPYYDSVQYVIFNKENPPETRGDHIVWEALAGKTLGSQMGGTGYLFMSDEVGEGVLKDTGTVVKGFDSHQLAADAIGAHIIDYAIADELAAQFIVEKNPKLAALPLYYQGATIEEDYPAEESYAIAVNKQQPELLDTFNEVLVEMLEPDEDGKSEIDKLILKYMGLTEEK